MRFTRLVSTFAAIGAITMLAVAGCSSEENKATGGDGGEDGGASNTTTAKGGAAGAATTPTKGGSAGAAGAATTTTTTTPTTTLPTAGAAGAATTTPGSGGKTGTAGAGTTTAAGGVTTTTTTTTVAGAGGITTTAVGGATGVAGGTGVGGTTSTGSTLDDLIGAICGWEFKCCDAGEAKWELGPLVTTVAACKEKFVYLLHSDNAAASPYPVNGSAAINGLLISLGYALNTDRVTENPTGIKACIDQWTAMACNAPANGAAAPAHCAATSVGYIAPCDLTNLVKPKVVKDGVCNFSLTEGAYNDVECVAGTTCLDKGNVDNPNVSYPSCVTRGVAATTCTLDKDCDFNFYCGAAGKCVEKGSAGTTCAFKVPATPKPNEMAAPCKPGLSCDPATLKCIENCKADYTCTSDYECPAGLSCMPITVGNDATSFKACKAVGSVGTGGVKCDTKGDCPTGNFCDAGLCAAQKASAIACSSAVEGNCATGMFCKEGATPPAGVCTAYTAAGATCARAATATTIADVSCDPSTTIGCVHKGTLTADEFICSSTLLANAARCTADIDCVHGRCEFAAPTSTYKTCIAGAIAGELCDSVLTSALDGKTRCGPGLNCDPTSTKCIPSPIPVVLARTQLAPPQMPHCARTPPAMPRSGRRSPAAASCAPTRLCLSSTAALASSATGGSPISVTAPLARASSAI